MTRREQIMDAAMFFAKKNKNNPSPYLDFVEAAEWADRTMIEKACEWMEENLYGYFNYEGVTPEEISNDVISDFRKAMQNE